MSTVISYIRDFDAKYPDWVSAAEEKLLNLHVDLQALYKSSVWKIENLDDLHSFFDTLEHQVSDEPTSGIFARPLHTNSVIGGFVRDMVVYFQGLEFNQRAKMWETFQICRNRVFEANEFTAIASIFPQTSVHLEPEEVVEIESRHFDEVVKSVRDLDLHGAIREIHRVYDESSIAQPAEALVMVFCVLAFHSHIDNALKVAEEAIVAARTEHDMDTIVSVVMSIWETLHLFPDCKVPKSIGSLNRLMEYLLTISSQQNYSTRFRIAIFEITYLRESGTSLDILAKKLTGLMQLYTSIKLNDEATAAFHRESYMVWSLYGKADLAQCHFDMVKELMKKEKYYAADLSYRFQTCALLEQGFEGNADSALAELEKLKQEDHVGRLQLYKVTKLILNMVSLTKRSKYHEASIVLGILRSIPAKQSIMYQTAIKYAEIELLLAQGQNTEAYEESMRAYNQMNDAKYLLYAARSLFCFSESSIKVRRVEALEVARDCESCNSVPIKIEAKIIRALAHAHSESVSEFRNGVKLCDECIPEANAAQRPRLLVDALVIKTMCILQLYYLKEATIKEVKRSFNLAQAEVNSYSSSSFSPQGRQLYDLYDDIVRESNAEDLLVPNKVSSRTSLIKVTPEKLDLKRKSYHSERRASKRRRSLLMPL